MPTIKRERRSHPFVQMDKRALQDKSLSWKAKGLLAYLLSLPDDWQIYLNELKNHAKDGRDGTASAIKELLSGGYLSRTRKRDGGKFIGWEYVVHEQCTENGLTENGKSEFGKTENGKSDTTNNNSTNKDSTDNELENTPPDGVEPINDDFEEFWEQFANKKEKKKSLTAWKRLSKTKRRAAIDAIPAYKAYLKRTGYSQMYPTTWINGERWTDDFSEPKPEATVVTMQPDSAERLRKIREEIARREATAAAHG